MTYKVGFKKPPLESQFQKGVSGNPKGRPKGSRNSATLLFNILHDQTLAPSSKRNRASRLEVVIRTLVDQATAGETSAVKALLDLMAKYDRQEEPSRARERCPPWELAKLRSELEECKRSRC